jgi:hypothetical protein
LQKVIEHPLAEPAGPHLPPRTYFGITTTNEIRRNAVTLLRSAEEGLEAAHRKQERIAAI